MQRFIVAGILLQLAATPVLAQTAQTTPSAAAPSTAPSTISSPATPPTTPPAAMAPNPAVPDTSSTASAAPESPAGGVPGANSFTESQARSRLEGNGFSNVSGLTKDIDGIWRGKATKDTTQVAVGVDFKGNIVTQ